MPNDSTLIADPVLDDRQEADRIAARIYRSIGGLTSDDAQLIIDYGTSLQDMLDSAGAISDPLLPELSSARPAEAHVAMLTELERMGTETLFRFNQLPNKNRVGFLRLLGVRPNSATAATTTLQFTKTTDYLNIDIVITAGTEVSTDDLKTRVTTDVDLDIPAGTLSASVSATADQVGDIGRIPANTLALAQTPLAGISSVINTVPLAGGREGETSDQAAIRARELMSVGQHLGNSIDWVNYIYFNVLGRKGRVTPFEGYRADFSLAGLGFLLLVVQDDTGAFPSQSTLNNVASLISARHVAGVQVSVTGPQFKQFDLAAQVTIGPGIGAAPLIAKATANLQAFYDPMKFAYGPQLDQSGNPAVRFISLSDIVGQIEAAGPQSISVKNTGGVFAVTLTINRSQYQNDVSLAVGELPRLGNVTLSVVS